MNRDFIAQSKEIGSSPTQFENPRDTKSERGLWHYNKTDRQRNSLLIMERMLKSSAHLERDFTEGIVTCRGL